MTSVLAQAEAASPTAELVVFVVVGAIALGSAVSMVLMRNAVHAALMLVVNFFAIAIFYATLEAPFLAVAQIIVYAGAIVVLFLFVLMLLGVGGGQAFSERIRGQRTAAVLLGLALLMLLLGTVPMPFLGEGAACNLPAEQRSAADGVICEGLGEVNADGNLRAVGLRLFTDYLWPFEVMSVLLVIAALGAMVLGKRGEEPADLTDAPPGGVPEATGDIDYDAPAGAGEGERP